MSEYKLICLDIDGTLLNSSHKISELTKEIIEFVVSKKHIPVILVSARMPNGMIPIHNELNLVEPMICYSGALIWDEGDILSNVKMSTTQVEIFLDWRRQLGLHVSIYKDNKWYVESMDEWALQESEITKGIPLVVDFDVLLKEWNKSNDGPNKMLIMSNPEKIRLLLSNLKSMEKSGLSIYPSKKTYLEISSALATKTSAIEVLCKKYGVNQNEIIAIGDNYNDISMIEFAGLGIAMGNAPDEVKQIANEITDTCDDDGVAKALIKHIISGKLY